MEKGAASIKFILALHLKGMLYNHQQVTALHQEGGLVSKKLNIPTELQDVFQRLLQRLPPEHQADADLQKSLLVFLKLGGENLAARHIDLVNISLTPKVSFTDFLPRVPVVVESANDEEESDDDEDSEEDNDEEG